MKKLIILLNILIFCFGCELIDIHPYDVHVTGDTNINTNNVKRIEKLCSKKNIFSFAVIGDTQRNYDETEEFVKQINQRNDIDFVIHAGDISDFGITHEFIWMRDILNKLSMPYVALIGNHDCLGNGQESYNTIFGAENFAFSVGNTRIICLNTNALEFDYSHPVPDFTFIENELEHLDPNIEKTIFVMHVKPYDEQFNNNIAKAFQYTITSFPNVQFCVHAHNHRIEINDVFNDGILYYGSGCIKERNYLVFTITPEQYYYDVVYF
ncbi:MAG TPA: metallophosphoesterase [Candidatus Avirikenella pullistercoris]|nr:metallophosphoesterase [Candidatus Avirikenella pullistercoris]